MRPNVLLIAVLIVLALAVWGGIGATHHLIVAIDRWGDAGASTAMATAQIQTTLKKLNGPGGTLTMADEDLGAAKSAIIHLDLVARHEQQQLSKLDMQEETLFADLHGTLAATTGVLQETRGDLQTLNGVLADTRPVLGAAATTVGDLDLATKAVNRRITDPRVDQFMGYLTSTAGHVDGIAGDVQWRAHQLLHPDKVKLTFWSGVWAVAQGVHSMTPPLF